MADLSVMGFLNEETQQETEYNLKDAQARQDIATINDKIGSANGIAELDNAGKVPSSQLPSYVDDVIEGYYNSTNDRFYEESTFVNMITPVEGKSWVDIPANKSYRWTGSVYVRVDEGVQLGETSDTAYAGNKGKANADAIAAMKDGSYIDSFADVETALAGKVDKVSGKGLSTNDYINADKAVVSTAQDNIKANTKLIKDTVGWSGKNKLDTSIVLKLYVDTGNSKYASNDSAHLCVAKVSPNTKYNVTKQAGTQFRVASSQNYPANNVPYTQTIANHTGTKIEITTGANDYYIGVYTTEADMATCMVMDANILDDTYEPYFGSTAFPRSEQAVLGAKNLLAPKWQVGTGTGITFTVNSDGSVTANGTASGDNTFVISKPDMPADIPLILNGCPSGGSGTTYFMQYTNEVDNAYNDFGNGVNITKFNYSTYANAKIVIKIKSGQTVNNLVFKPMISLDGGEYVPYAMTNKELTEMVFEKGTLTNANDLNDIKTTGIYSVTTAPANSPENKEYATLVVKKVIPTLVHQMFIRPDCIYTRRYDANQSTPWGNWFKFTGTMIS